MRLRSIPFNRLAEGNPADIMDVLAARIFSDRRIQMPILPPAPGGVTDHGALTGLADDDHTQYALLAGRASGQTLTGGTAAGENLNLRSTSHATKGVVDIGEVGTQEWGDGTLRVVRPQTDMKVDLGDGTHRLNDLYVGGDILKTAGTSTAAAVVGGTLSVNTTTVGNVGTGEDDLMSYAIPGAVLATDKERLKFTASGTIANNANAKRIRVKYGATTILDTGAGGIPASAAIDWSVEGEIIRTSGTTQKCRVTMRTSNSTFTGSCDYTTAAETLSGGVTLKFTGEATSNNDVVQETMAVEYCAAP